MYHKYTNTVAFKAFAIATGVLGRIYISNGEIISLDIRKCKRFRITFKVEIE